MARDGLAATSVGEIGRHPLDWKIESLLEAPEAVFTDALVHRIADERVVTDNRE